MSKTVGASFLPHSSSSLPDQSSKNAFPTSTLPATELLAPVTTPSSLAGPSTWQAPLQWNANQPVPKAVTIRKSIRASRRTTEEQEIESRTASNFASRLTSDHATALFPDADTPFSDPVDVVNRLLPYHVFQQPKEDLDASARARKGKEKAIESDVKAEIAETKFALECFKRYQSLQTRFRNVKLRSGKRSAPDDQGFVLAQAVLEADRTEITYLNTELRNARAELDKIEREKRLAANPHRSTYISPHSASPAQPQYYRGYPYTHAQPYGAPAQSNSTSTFSVSAPPSSNYAPYLSGAAIPVQLPVASLPALHALGIVPIPATSLPPDGQPQPPAVLRGSTANGTMLSLEINVSLLQNAQMSGLAMVLNSLMSRGVTAGGGAEAGTTSATSSSGSAPNGASDKAANDGGSS